MTNDLRIRTFTVNFIEENCHVLSDDSGEAVIVDCGAFFDEEREALARYIADEGLRPVHLLCTHGHFDHVFGAQFVYDTYGLQPEMAADELPTYMAAAAQMRQFLHRDLPLELPPHGRLLAEGDTVSFGHHMLRAIATPGHTPGGLCYYCEEEALLLSGDSLFRRAIGRCDLPGGNAGALVDALTRKITGALPEEVRVLPGHGPATTVGEERRENPYLP